MLKYDLELGPQIKETPVLLDKTDQNETCEIKAKSKGHHLHPLPSGQHSKNLIETHSKGEI